MRKKIILDVDTGSDDTIAIITALKAEELELECMTTTWGNVAIEEVVENTLRVLDLATSQQAISEQIPVYQGAAAPLARDLYSGRQRRDRYAGIIDGEKIYMHPPILEGRTYQQRPESKFAPFYYIDYLRAVTEPLTIVATGPLTNLGIALSLAPDIVEKIEDLIVMGGGIKKSNVTAYAEANFWNDPEAVALVLDSGLKPLIVPLDATHEAYLTRAEYLEIFSGDDDLSRLCRDLLEQRQKLHDLDQPLAVPEAVTAHDVLAVVAAYEPEVLAGVEEVACRIALSPEANGHLLIDRRENPELANARFAYHADRECFIAALRKVFKK